jgi:hypothetical protein
MNNYWKYMQGRLKEVAREEKNWSKKQAWPGERPGK